MDGLTGKLKNMGYNSKWEYLTYSGKRIKMKKR